MTDGLKVQKQPYWDDVDIGESLSGFSLRLDWTTMVLSVSGAQDFNRVHHDAEFARDSGHTGVFYHTGWTSGMLNRVITDWMGPEGWLCELQFEMRQMNMQGDTVRASGKVVDKRIEPDGRHVVILDIWLENDRVGVTTPGTAVVWLPAKSTQSSGQTGARGKQ